jgi:hypothetical protein
MAPTPRLLWSGCAPVAVKGASCVWRVLVVLLLLVVLLGACTTTSSTTGVRPGASTTAPSPLSQTSDPGERPDSKPAYTASIRSIGTRLRQRMRYSHHPGCPVSLTELRYLQMTYLGFDEIAHTGEMVVHKDHAGAVAEVFRRLYDAGWPIERMRLVDTYRGSDERSMAANNTSGYNCRHVAGTDVWSTHAYGAAIDINPVQNPYVTGSSIYPLAGTRFATIDRSHAAGHRPMGAIRAGDVVVRAFDSIGWDWGGDWSTSPDYQHFSASSD